MACEALVQGGLGVVSVLRSAYIWTRWLTRPHIGSGNARGSLTGEVASHKRRVKHDKATGSPNCGPSTGKRKGNKTKWAHPKKIYIYKEYWWRVSLILIRAFLRIRLQKMLTWAAQSKIDRSGNYNAAFCQFMCIFLRWASPLLMPKQ